MSRLQNNKISPFPRIEIGNQTMAFNQTIRHISHWRLSTQIQNATIMPCSHSHAWFLYVQTKWCTLGNRNRNSNLLRIWTFLSLFCMCSLIRFRYPNHKFIQSNGFFLHTDFIFIFVSFLFNLKKWIFIEWGNDIELSEQRCRYA